MKDGVSASSSISNLEISLIPQALNFSGSELYSGSPKINI